MEHKHDESLDEKGKSHTWKIQPNPSKDTDTATDKDKDTAFQMFRIRMTGPNSNDNIIWLVLDLKYGELSGTIIEPKIIEKTFKYQSDFDKNGILYFLGCDYGKSDWQNPSEKD